MDARGISRYWSNNSYSGQVFQFLADLFGWRHQQECNVSAWVSVAGSGHHFLSMGSLVTDYRAGKKKASNAHFEKTILLKDFILLIKISWRPQVSA